MANLKPHPMTLERAIEILHPDTTLLALGEIEYFAGFNGQEAKIKACEAACIVACEAMQREVERRAQPANDPLTLDELRGMDGQPVWSEIGAYWLLVDVTGTDVWLTDPSGQQANAAGWIKRTKEMGNLYRRPPADKMNVYRRIYEQSKAMQTCPPREKTFERHAGKMFPI